MAGMNRLITTGYRIVTALSFCVLGFASTAWAQSNPGKTIKQEVAAVLESVHWLGHSGVLIKGSKAVVVVDPYEIAGIEKICGKKTADVILITHGHGDHLSPDDIEKIRGKGTVTVVPAGCEAGLKGNVRTIKPGEKITVGGVDVEAVPAYNIGKRFHPKDKGFVGYVFRVDGVRYFHAGDTDAVPEIKSVAADVAFLPVGGTYTMTAAEAAGLANSIKPKIAVPIHWGSVVGSSADAETFKKCCDCEVQILKHE
jgi:L-ascorbate metabolism protein UlaG (beta-lactamase superfamily)